MATFLPKLLSRAGSDVGRLGNRHALATTEHLPSRGRLGIGLTSGIASRGALPAGAASSPPMTRTELAAALMARGQQAVPLLSAREMLHADQTRARPSRAHPARRRWWKLAAAGKSSGLESLFRKFLNDKNLLW